MNKLAPLHNPLRIMSHPSEILNKDQIVDVDLHVQELWCFSRNLLVQKKSIKPKRPSSSLVCHNSFSRQIEA
jgi:hypothetical protein